MRAGPPRASIAVMISHWTCGVAHVSVTRGRVMGTCCELRPPSPSISSPTTTRKPPPTPIILNYICYDSKRVLLKLQKKD